MSQKKFFKKNRRNEKTDFNSRLKMLKSAKSRLIVRLSNKNIIAQVAEYTGGSDKIIIAVSTKSLEKIGWKGSKTNLPAAYLLGYLLGKKASSKVKEAILDLGKRRSVLHSRIYAVVKGVIDGGVHVPAEDIVFPEEDRISGEHIKNYAMLLIEQDKETYSKKFSLYLKNDVKPEDLPNHFKQIKLKIDGGVN
jgi:large subunit ribosomal protein L18